MLETIVISFIVIISVAWLLYYVVAMIAVYLHLRKRGQPMHWALKGVAITAVAFSALLAVLIS